jgi:tRNA(Arg) A34 adenosine deaminase TadA
MGLSNGKQLHDATSHAETEALRKASKKLSSRDLNGAIVYSSMEPCLMCFSACYWAKVKKVVYAIGKESLPKIHYEGLHNLEEINKVNNRQIEIVHLKELEAKAFEVINEWRTKISKK